VLLLLEKNVGKHCCHFFFLLFVVVVDVFHVTTFKKKEMRTSTHKQTKQNKKKIPSNVPV